MRRPNKPKKQRSFRGGSNKKKDAQKNSKPKEELPTEDMRLNKYIAHCGICSRRKADEHIKAGKVKVNSEVVLEPGHRVQAKDKVYFEGKPVRPERNKVYVLLNKPKNYITTVSDDRGRKTVMDLVQHKIKERIFPVGRLDRATVGLLLLTNDGDLAKKLSHPSHEVKKVYHVVLNKEVSTEHIDAIRKGFDLEDGAVQVDSVGHIDGAGLEEVGIEIHIGRNRIVRRIFEHFGYEVKKLDRVYYAGLTKKDLPRGWFRHLTKREVIMLKHFT